MLVSVAILLFAIGYLVRDGVPHLGSTFLARVVGAGLCMVGGFIAREWLGAALGLAVGVGFWTDQQHGEGQEAREWRHMLYLPVSGATSLAPLAVAFALAGLWRGVAATALVALLKPAIWFAAWRVPFVRDRYPTRWAAASFGTAIGGLTTWTT